ncbi:hypothetical protein D3C73_937750 [compost metagenome]
MAVLAFTPGLAHELAFHVGHALADGFAVRHLRFAGGGRHAKLTPHTIDDDFQVQFAHAVNNGLAGILVGANAERRIFRREALQGNPHSFLIGLGFRLNRLGDHRFREHHFFQRDNGVRVTQRVAGGDVF